MPSILFVCTANLFRSPIAAESLKKYIKKNNVQGDWRIQSAGTWTKKGFPVPGQAINITRKLGLEGYKNHLTCPIDEVDINNFDLIIAMESGQKEAILSEFPQTRERLFLLSEFEGSLAYDIQDPGNPGVAMEPVAIEIHDLLMRDGQKILQSAQSLHFEK